MKEIADDDGPEPLYPSMEMLLQAGLLIAPRKVHTALEARAHYLQATCSKNLGFRAESRMMRAIQDGIDFGKWPQ